MVVTDQPIHFVGGGAVDAKPRAGDEVAVIQMQMDDVGLGSGNDGGGRPGERRRDRRRD